MKPLLPYVRKATHAFRSAVTGRFITKDEAKKSPTTSVRETRKKNRMW